MRTVRWVSPPRSGRAPPRPDRGSGTSDPHDIDISRRIVEGVKHHRVVQRREDGTVIVRVLLDDVPVYQWRRGDRILAEAFGLDELLRLVNGRSGQD